MKEVIYEVYAIKYAARAATASEHFLSSGDPHDNPAMPASMKQWLKSASANS